jgi:hypothetical protein
MILKVIAFAAFGLITAIMSMSTSSVPPATFRESGSCDAAFVALRSDKKVRDYDGPFLPMKPPNNEGQMDDLLYKGRKDDLPYEGRIAETLTRIRNERAARSRN